MFFVGLDDEDFVSHTLKALGSVCVRHYEFMLRPELKEFYHQLLTSELAPVEMKADVLRNIEMYLQEEEQRMIRQDKECKVSFNAYSKLCILVYRKCLETLTILLYLEFNE